MKCQEWLAVLQNMAWEPCKESSGLPRYRATAAYYCTFCAYTVCVRCYNAIPTALLFPSRGAPVVEAKESSGIHAEVPLADGNSTKDEELQPCGPLGDEDLGRPRCFFCRQGELVWEAVPVFEWTCEGPRPPRRLQRGSLASYDADVVQRYYTMKEQRDKRALSKAPLVAQFHGTEGPLARFVFANGVSSANKNAVVANDIIGNGVVDRRPFCEEGSSFFFSIQNPRMEVLCVWCAVNRRLSEAHPSLVGEETITPLQIFRCPPSLPGFPSQRFRVSVPYGAYGLHNIHALALFLKDDIFQKATAKLQLTAGNGAMMEVNGQQSRRGQLRAGKELPCQFMQPILTVDVLHRIATSDPVQDLFSPEWLTKCVQYFPGEVSVPPKTCQAVTCARMKDSTCADETLTSDGDDTNAKNDNAVFYVDDCSALPHDEVKDDASIAWPGDLRCAELLLTVDYLLQGRSVAVYGIASKYFFLQHVLQSAELRHYGIVVVDGYRTANSRITHHLREVQKHLQQLQQRAEQELLHSFVVYDTDKGPVGPGNRSVSPEREQQSQTEEAQCHIVDSPFRPSSLRSQSYGTPLHNRVMEDGLSQSLKMCGNNVTDESLSTFMQSHLGNTPPPAVAVGNVPFCSPAPLQRTRGSSVLLVRGEEEVGVSTLGPHMQETHSHFELHPRQSQVEESLLVRKGAGVENMRAWSRRYCLREHSEWNYDVPVADDQRGKRLRNAARRDGKNEVGDGEAEELVLRSLRDYRPRVPRFTVSSVELMRSLRLACRAPHRSCVDWISLPSLTATSLISIANSNMVPYVSLPRNGGRITIIVVHGVDQLDVSALLELQTIAREYPHRVLLLCSFDNPNWMLSSGANLLNSYRFACVQLHSILLPRVREMSAIHSLSLLIEMENSAAGGGRFSHYANRRGAPSGGTALPLYDTMRRILFSLPATFSELLRCMIKRQEASGENVFVPMSLHQEHFDACGLMVSMARLKAIERELTSNRLAVFNSAENKLMIPQHRKLLKVLEEVLGQRCALKSTSDKAAPVEA